MDQVCSSLYANSTVHVGWASGERPTSRDAYGVSPPFSSYYDPFMKANPLPPRSSKVPPSLNVKEKNSASVSGIRILNALFRSSKRRFNKTPTSLEEITEKIIERQLISSGGFPLLLFIDEHVTKIHTTLKITGSNFCKRTTNVEIFF